MVDLDNIRSRKDMLKRNETIKLLNSQFKEWGKSDFIEFVADLWEEKDNFSQWLSNERGKFFGGLFLGSVLTIIVIGIITGVL